MRPFEGTPFEAAVMPGLTAIAPRAYRRRIQVEGNESGGSLFSVDIDAAMRDGHPGAHRWDYGIWYGRGKPKAAYVEAHKAESGEVDIVLRKHDWLKGILLGASLPPSSWYWLATGKNKIPPQSAQMRRLYMSGIRLVTKSIELG